MIFVHVASYWHAYMPLHCAIYCVYIYIYRLQISESKKKLISWADGCSIMWMCCCKITFGYEYLEADEGKLWVRLSDCSDSYRYLWLYLFRSVNPGSSPVHAGIATVPGAVPEDDSTLLLSDTDGGCLKRSQIGDSSSGGTLQTCPELAGPGHDTAELQDFRAQNRRLLPNLKNPLHVIDGPEQRYFIGIIDIFTVYSFKKRLEHWWKRLRHPGRSFSTVSPQTYCLRLCHWVRDHTK